MLEIIALTCLIGAVVILYCLSVIDLKHGILPNELVLGFLALGFVFHITTLFYFAHGNMIDLVIGCVVGGGMLYLIRQGANYYYDDDALGLGDVKLLGAAGVWLGAEYVLIAMIAGSIAGFLHGGFLALRAKIHSNVNMNIGQISVPAGPGFAIGILVAAFFKLFYFPALFILPLFN